MGTPSAYWTTSIINRHSFESGGFFVYKSKNKLYLVHFNKYLHLLIGGELVQMNINETDAPCQRSPPKRQIINDNRFLSAVLHCRYKKNFGESCEFMVCPSLYIYETANPCSQFVI